VSGQTVRDAKRPLSVEGLVARALFWSGLLSIAVVILGLGLYAAHGGFHAQVLDLHRPVRAERDAHPPTVFVSLTEVAQGLTARPLDPLAVIALGLILLLATPVLGVALAIPGFLAAGDRRYAIIATIILAMLTLGALLTGGVG
jgi:uncharacterized membrane protein